MRIVVVMTYYERPYQLEKTLRSIEKTSHKDFEVIVVDDVSPNNIVLNKYQFPVTVIKPTDKDWTDRDIPANRGFYEALKRGADVIISQNAECYHVGDVISQAAKISDAEYLAYACYSLNKENTFSDHDINEVIKNHNEIVKYTGDLGWYNHPVHRPVYFDFCAAISRKNMVALNGFDERLSYGIGRGDNYWIERIKLMGLKMSIPTNPFVVHQWHYGGPKIDNAADLVKKNTDLYKILMQNIAVRAQHLKTPEFQ